MKALLKIALTIALLNFSPAFAQAPKNRSCLACGAEGVQRLHREIPGGAQSERCVRNHVGMTRFPFGSNAADAAEFRAKIYPDVFNAKTRTCIQRGKAVYDRDGLNNDNFFIFCGEDIFVFTKTPAGFLFTEIGVND
jgi:hypothetical protein